MTEPTKRHGKKAWSHSEGEYGHRIRVFEDPNSGIMYGEMRDVNRPGRYRSVSLRHRDRERAKRWAKDQAAAWVSGEMVSDPVPTASHIFALYLKHQTPTKVDSEQDADERRAKMWCQFLAPSKDLSKISLREWQSFIDSRRSGAIDPLGQPVVVDKRRVVRDGTVAADLVFLVSVLNWATKWRENDRYLMHENPVRGFSIPNEKNPRRPVVTEDRFQKVRAVAHQVTMTVLDSRRKKREEPSYLPEILDLANGTGRRVSSILALRYQDLRLCEGGPHGAICWPAETDKMKREWTVPIAAEVRRALDRVLADRPGIGAAFLFPAPNHPSQHVQLEVAAAWLMKAEQLAGLEKQKGSLWHAYRRKWATERKWLPAADVAAAGGWSDLGTLTQVYQQADVETMYRVVSEPAKLTERVG